MNVGSILNKESPPSDNEGLISPNSKTVEQPPSAHERHSIVNILNDAPQSDTAPVSPSDKFNKPASTPPVGASKIKRNSIANITNDRDVDIATGKVSAVNISRQSSYNDDIEPPKQKVNILNNDGPKKSPKQLPNDELLKLKHIKSSSKPRRYTSPPVWAQHWIPPNQRHRNNQHQNNNNNNNNNNNSNNNNNTNNNNPSSFPAQENVSVLSEKRVFDYSSTPSVDLECSITGVIPAPSITRSIAEWIFANFRDIAEHNRKYVELELKFGTIMDKAKNQRLNLNVTTECVYTDHASVYFEMLVEEKAWQEISKLMLELESTYQDELKKLNPNQAKSKPKRKFNTFDEDITDSFYQMTTPGERSKSVRISKDKSLNPPRYTGIEKQRISHLFIHNPSSMYDLRLSLSLEMPLEDGAVEPLVQKSVPKLVRDKKRNSWSHAPTITRFDLTQVLIPHESKNKSGKKIVTHEKNYEVELEIDTFQVFSAMDKIQQGTDRFRFEELVEIYINNARVLNNRVTRLALP